MEPQSSKETILDKLRQEMPALRQQYGVERIVIYGSFARGEPTETSDVDILVKLSKPLGLTFIQLAEHLEELLDHPVDLATFESLERSAANPRRAHVAAEITRTMTDV
jgi:predicted nucleotidyltransferase